jgi:preprotein translocase subunit YajC
MLSLSFIAPVHAAAAAAAPQAGVQDYVMSFLPLILIVAIFYFLLIRPQQKRAKQHGETLAAMKRGDRVITGGGIIGTLSKLIDDQEVMVEVADGVKIRVLRSTISAVFSKEAKEEKSEPKQASSDN